MDEKEYLSEMKQTIQNEVWKLTQISLSISDRLKVLRLKKGRCDSCGAKLHEYFEINGIKLCKNCYVNMKPKRIGDDNNEN